MKSTLILVFGVLISYSYFYATDNYRFIGSAESINKTKRVIEIQKINSDSISDFKETGIKILNGKKLSEINGKYILRFIDSIMTKKSEDRTFYFKVLNKIRVNAKGEILEFIHWKILSFSKKYPNYFFCLTDTELNYYAKVIGEIFVAEEESPILRAKNYIVGIKKISNSKFVAKIDLFESEINKTIRNRK